MKSILKLLQNQVNINGFFVGVGDKLYLRADCIEIIDITKDKIHYKYNNTNHIGKLDAIWNPAITNKLKNSE